MEWKFVLHDKDRYLEVVTSGRVDGDGTINMAQAIAQTMKSQRLTRALIDHRNVESVTGSTLATYNRPKILRLIGLTLGIKLAELIRPEHQYHFKFFETVCFNQGYKLSVFYDKDQALGWLLT